jgi:hypothetical protein
MQAPADDRAGAVGADQRVAFDTSPVTQIEAHARRRDGVSGGFAVDHQCAGACRREQRAMQRLAQRDHAPAGKRVPAETPAVRPPDLEFGRRTSLRDHRAGNSERRQGGDRIRREGEGKSQLVRRSRALADAHLPSRAAKRDGRRQAADAGAGDERGAGDGRHV